MVRVISVTGKYKIISTGSSRGLPFLVIDTLGSYENHSHFSTLKSAKKCVQFLIKKQKPTRSKYMQKAVRRVAGDDYELFIEKKTKDRYVNR